MSSGERKRMMAETVVVLVTRQGLPRRGCGVVPSCSCRGGGVVRNRGGSRTPWDGGPQRVRAP